MATRLVGQMAPDFAADDTHGNRVELAGFRGKNAVVLVLNRGCT
jgi:peroxiredoxin